MKKGFTLIELLAIISILAIVLLVAIPKVIDVINDVKQTVLVKNNEILIKATKNYLSANQTFIPTIDGQTIEILLSDLQTNKFIDIIKDPYDNSVCTGYILVTKLTNDISYTPHLNCGVNINNSADDKLLVNYKFDDFQEPTENIFPRSSNSLAFNNAYNGTGYGFGINTNMQQEINNSMQFDTRASITKVTRINSGISQRDYVSIGLSSPLNSTRIFSFWYYGTYGTIIRPYNNDSSASLYYLDAFGNWIGGATGVDIPVTENNWQKIVVKIENRGVISGTGLSWMILHYNQMTPVLANTEFWAFSLFQYEQKLYATPYTNTTRNGVITDYSSNNNSSNLDIITTPKWIEKGYYQFNGTDNYINLSGKNLNSPATYSGSATVSLWINPKKHTNGIARYMAGFHYWTINESGKLQNMVHKPIAAANYWLYGNAVIPIDEWTHIAYTIEDNVGVTFYVNGVLDAQYLSNDIGITSYSTDSALGATYNEFFEGNIDNFKIYARALTSTELKNTYNFEKNNYK